MNKLLLAALTLPLLVGCGRRYYQPNPYQCTVNCGTLPVEATSFLIDAGAGVDSGYGYFAVTTNGEGDWYIGWQGDGLAHRYTGDIYAPSTARIAQAVFTNANIGDSVNQVAPNHFGFDAVTDHSVRQTLQISTLPINGAEQPMAFDLYIDGQAAIGAVVFPSGGQVGTTDRMPFSLVSDNAAFSADAEIAPEAKKQVGVVTTLAAPVARPSQASTTAR